MRANSRLALNESVARIAGPSLGGVLVQTLTAPIAIAADAGSFIVSAIALWTIKISETVPDRASRRSIWTEIGEGMRFLAGDRFIQRHTSD